MLRKIFGHRGIRLIINRTEGDQVAVVNGKRTIVYRSTAIIIDELLEICEHIIVRDKKSMWTNPIMTLSKDENSLFSWETGEGKRVLICGKQLQYLFGYLPKQLYIYTK